jgi:hypothetical protein
MQWKSINLLYEPFLYIYFEFEIKIVYKYDCILICWSSPPYAAESPIFLFAADLVLSNKLVFYDLENQVIGWTEYNCECRLIFLYFIVHFNYFFSNFIGGVSPPSSKSIYCVFFSFIFNSFRSFILYAKFQIVNNIFYLQHENQNTNGFYHGQLSQIVHVDQHF